MVSKSIVYYTDSLLDEKIAESCRDQLAYCAGSHDGIREVISVSLNKKLAFGTWYLTVYGERGPLTMFRQILLGLEQLTSDVVFLCEHDVLYEKSHFDLTPPDPAKVYYNHNWWQVRTSDGHCVRWDANKVSQLCAYRELLIDHYRKRIEICERVGFSMAQGYEPAGNNRAERVDDLKSDFWVSRYPNVDIKHGSNLTPAKWKQSDFRSQRNCQNWKESDELEYWGKTKPFSEFLARVSAGV